MLDFNEDNFPDFIEKICNIDKKYAASLDYILNCLAQFCAKYDRLAEKTRDTCIRGNNSTNAHILPRYSIPLKNRFVLIVYEGGKSVTDIELRSSEPIGTTLHTDPDHPLIVEIESKLGLRQG